MLIIVFIAEMYIIYQNNEIPKARLPEKHFTFPQPVQSLHANDTAMNIYNPVVFYDWSTSYNKV